MKTLHKNLIALVLIVVVAIATSWTVNKFHQPGHLDVIAAQAMDMSQMRPPIGAAPVALAPIKMGSLESSVTYTGSVEAYNQQDISARITGQILSLPVYPGDTVHTGELVAQLDSAEVSAQSEQAQSEAQSAEENIQIVHITHDVHHGAALDQAKAQLSAAQQGVLDAGAELTANQDTVADTVAGVQSAKANSIYWTSEIAREKRLAAAGAASQQEYQNEIAQAQAAFAAEKSAEAKVSQARATVASSQAKLIEAQNQVEVAQDGVKMADADIAVAEGQAEQAGEGAEAAQSAAQAAEVVQGYTRIVSPENGVVVSRPISPGTLVQPGTTILTIAEIDEVRVQANVAISDLGGIAPGNPVEIVPQDGGQSIAAKVSSVFPSANPDTRTAVVEADIPNPGHRLLPGAFVSVQIFKHAPSISQMLVPVSSIVTEGGQSFVWTTSASAAGNSSVVHEIAVQVDESNDKYSAVESPSLNAGDQVVVQGQAGLIEGTRVVATDWGPNGPKTLPVAAKADADAITYRCSICGMHYSAADAKKLNYVDPMDGGKLVPVTPGAAE
jgi:RND family efflux transporter MFP subunit